MYAAAVIMDFVRDPKKARKLHHIPTLCNALSKQTNKASKFVKVNYTLGKMRQKKKNVKRNCPFKR